MEVWEKAQLRESRELKAIYRHFRIIFEILGLTNFGQANFATILFAMKLLTTPEAAFPRSTFHC